MDPAHHQGYSSGEGRTSMSCALESGRCPRLRRAQQADDLGAWRPAVRAWPAWRRNLGRFSLWCRDQIHFLGNYLAERSSRSPGSSSWLVLGLQGYYTLRRYVDRALGLLGMSVVALLFAGRAGTSPTAEIGLMKAGEQLSAMEMAVDPVQRILAPRSGPA